MTRRAKPKNNGKHEERCRSFLMLPTDVLDSPGYRQSSHTARSLLIDVAKQYKGSNNGALTAAAKYLEPLGWRSPGVITWALRELVAAGLLVLTRQGGLNSASWYAITWKSLDRIVGLDIDSKHFTRGGYMRPESPPCRPSHKSTAGQKIASTTTPGVAAQ